MPRRWFMCGCRFLSTPSARRATLRGSLVHDFLLISIHALREEGDFIVVAPPSQPTEFLSTPSARRATPCGWK